MLQSYPKYSWRPEKQIQQFQCQMYELYYYTQVTNLHLYFKFQKLVFLILWKLTSVAFLKFSTNDTKQHISNGSHILLAFFKFQNLFTR